MKSVLVILMTLFVNHLMVNAQVDKRVEIENSINPRINPELIDRFFLEVHKGSPYKMDADRKKAYLEQLSRISIVYSPYVENIHHPLLSSIDRMDKYNKDIDYSLNDFKPEEFNFIKYSFNFYLPYSQMIRVDNKDYLIVIKAYKVK